ncbi:MAG: hypothetical protein K6T83_07615 [Alicyclobacillus sp.]|nr:hypothetical protein [Alicyclobacillus sp.]
MAQQRRDQIFHIVIAVLALLMAGGVGLVAWRWHAQNVRAVVGEGRLVTPQAAQVERQRAWNEVPAAAGSDVQPTGTVIATPIRPSTQPRDLATEDLPASNASLMEVRQANMIVRVTGVGSDTTPAEVARVANLIQQYKVVSRDAETLRLVASQPIYIYVAHSEPDYEQKLASLGLTKREVKSIGQDTGGFTQGSSVLVPMFQNTTLPDLANTIGHELTHAILNQTVGRLPSWINEGLAVYNGMRVQESVQGSVLYEGYAAQMAESVLDAANLNQLVSLTMDESQVLQSHATYDLELQDWLAVSELIHKYGIGPFIQYFKRLQVGEADPTAFNRSFHTTYYLVNRQILRLLKTAARAGDHGFTVQLRFPAGFSGSVKILQHGSKVWRSVPAHPGQMTLQIAANGDVAKGASQVSTIREAASPDPETTYINLTPRKAFRFNGQLVKNCGFALDYHDGLYAFVNSWIETDGGNSQYLQTPSLFGVTLAHISNASSGNPLVPLLSG